MIELVGESTLMILLVVANDPASFILLMVVGELKLVTLKTSNEQVLLVLFQL